MNTKCITSFFWVLSLSLSTLAAAQAPDRILYNGKVLTVDEQFSTASAIAIRGERIVAVGDNATVRRLAGANTVQTDLAGKTVIPGMIDSHFHYLRGSDFGAYEVRWHGLTSRNDALAAITAKARTLQPGQWIFVLGGWHEQQFADKPGGFTQQELDQAAPHNPVFIQKTYTTFYMNGLATAAIAPAIGSLYQGGSVVRTSSTDGRIVMYAALKYFPYGNTVEKRMEEVKAFNQHLNSLGLTTVYDVGYLDGPYLPVARVAERKELNVRVFYAERYWADSPRTAQAAAEQLDRERPLQRDNTFGVLGIGEHIYGPIHDGTDPGSAPFSPQQWQQFELIATAAAKNGWQVNEHVMLDRTATTMLDIGERISAKYPIKDLRWTLGHLDLVGKENIERAKRLGWVGTVANHTVKPLNSSNANSPDIRMIQDSGMLWGMSSDGTVVATYNPFHTIWEYTAGKIYPDIVKYAPNEVITREQALIAHTRSNAYILFMEQELGTLEVGKLADLVVLDRDYMAIPIDDIRNVKPLMTMMSGKIVYQHPTP
jgi:predicted amidohydrolase YtcJ